MSVHGDESVSGSFFLSPMGVVLRELQREGGDLPIEVMTRLMDFNTVSVRDASGRDMAVPANTLVAFTAFRWRELGKDVWEFWVQAPGAPGAIGATARMFVAGADIFVVRAMSKVGLG